MATKTEKTMSKFAELLALNVNGHTEKKGKFTYLSWPYAVSELRKADEKATWEVVKFDGKPFCSTECGYFVEVAVTVDGVTLSQIHPVLDNNNKTIEKPNAFQINTSIQRCLVKAIALHGLGLYIYAGEDLPDGNGNDTNSEKSHDTISEQQEANLEALVQEVGANMEGFCKFFKIHSLAELPAGKFDQAVTMLEKKRG